MNSFNDWFQDYLRLAFKNRNLREFHIALESLDAQHDDDRDLNNIELFSEVLSVPNSGSFIQLLFEHGLSFYKVTTRLANVFYGNFNKSFLPPKPDINGMYPIQHVIQSHCADNLDALLSATIHKKNEIKFKHVMNTKLDGRNNFLHILISELTNENYEKVGEVIKILILNRCNPNLLNVENLTPFSLLLSSFVSSENRKDLINFVLKNSDVNLRLCMEKDLVMNGLQTCDVNSKSEFEYLKQQLNDENEEEFLKIFTQFKGQEHFYQALLEIAVEKNMVEIVDVLIEKGVDVNIIPDENRWDKEPAFLAASLGHKNIFIKFLKLEDLSFVSHERQKNILHEILSSHEIEAEDVQELFELVVMDQRLTFDMINSDDSDGKPVLFYACQNGNDIIVRELLKRGAYVGSSEVLKSIKFQVLESLLDESLSKKIDSYKEEKIFIDYQFLMPPVKEHKKKLVSKVEALKNIAVNPKLNSLLKHPVLMSFLDLKYKATKKTILFTSVMHFFCLAFLVWTMSYFLRHALEFTDVQQTLVVTIFFSIFLSMILLELYEIITSFQNYFFKLGNWLDLLMIGTIIFAAFMGNSESSETLLADFQKAGAFLILFVAGQCIKIVGASIYTTIFRKVCATFFKLIVMYSFLFITFALSFHILFTAGGTPHQDQKMWTTVAAQNESESMNETINGTLDKNFGEEITSSDYLDIENYTFTEDPSENEIRRTFIEQDDPYKTFGNVYISLYRVLAMFAGDLNTDQFTNPLKMALMIFFIFFITITLQNLMNSMAIIDTQEIISEAEIIGLKKRVALVYSYETFFAMVTNDWFRVFSKNKMNKYVLNPKKGRMLTLYDPLKTNVKSSKERDHKLVLSENAFNHITSFLERRENERLSTSVCLRCSARISVENVSDTRL